MQYSIDTHGYTVTATLQAHDNSGHFNVPLARAIVRQGPYVPARVEVNEQLRNITSWLKVNDAKEIVVRFQVGNAQELTNAKLIADVTEHAQNWLSAEMSRLIELRESLETLAIAYPQP